jgi:hypothetical protein
MWIARKRMSKPRREHSRLGEINMTGVCCVSFVELHAPPIVGDVDVLEYIDARLNMK